MGNSKFKSLQTFVDEIKGKLDHKLFTEFQLIQFPSFSAKYFD